MTPRRERESNIPLYLFIALPTAANGFVRYTNFFQANFREHITTDVPVGHGEDVLGHGVENGYFPSSVDPTISRNMVETGVRLCARLIED